MKALVLVAVLSGCATLFGGGPDQVTIASRPPGATIRVNGNVVGQTPMVLAFDRDSPALIQLDLDGYKPQSYELQKSFNTWTILNLTDPFGWIVDFATGNWQCYGEGVDIGMYALGGQL
jgi:hypothetical protein